MTERWPPHQAEGGLGTGRAASAVGATGGVISRVAFQERDQSRVNIFIDGQFAFALDAVEAVERGLKAGRQLTPAELTELGSLAERGRVRGRVLDLISRRPRSRRELVDHLRRKGHTPEVVEMVLDELTTRGYVDDAAFARYWVENRQANRPRGGQALAAELRAKGVEREVITAAVETTSDDEAATALALARRRADNLREPDPRRFRQRLAGFLQRKGFRSEIVWSVVRRVEAERAGSALDDDEAEVPE